MNRQVEHIKTMRSYYNNEVKNWKSFRTKFYYFVRRDLTEYYEIGYEIEKRWSTIISMMSENDQILFLSIGSLKDVNHQRRIYKRRRSIKVQSLNIVV
jgi:hypothetical protein